MNEGSAAYTAIARTPAAIQQEVCSTFHALFPGNAEDGFIKRAFAWFLEYYTGNHPGYLPLDTGYHDIEHTLDGTLCLMRLLRGRHAAGTDPRFNEHLFEMGLLAILFHDSGYLKSTDDRAGTGAKYTVTHVNRSAEFAQRLLSTVEFDDRSIEAIRDMILCTASNESPDEVPFANTVDHAMGCCVATADLLGQMASPNYVDKLPALQREFSEAEQYSGASCPPSLRFHDARHLMSQTSDFWQQYAWPRLSRHCDGMYKYLNVPFPDGPNEYLRRIEANVARVKEYIAAGTA